MVGEFFDQDDLITINIRLRSIRALLNYLAEKGLIKEVPLKFKMVKVDSTLPKFIKPEELQKIYSLVDNPKLLSTFRVFEATGMRLGELANSYRDGGYIVVVQSKGRKQRIIPLPLENIVDYDLARENLYSANFISHRFSFYCRSLGLSHSIHSLRHTFALRKLVETNNIMLVKELLGHSSVVVTEIYTKFPRDYLIKIFSECKSDNVLNVTTKILG